MDKDHLRQKLDQIYQIYNKRVYVHPDPLEFLYLYNNSGDMEIVGLISALLAYGRVEQILKKVEGILEILGTSPRDYLILNDEKKIRHDFENFIYRFTRSNHLASLLLGIRKILQEFTTLENCFFHGLNNQDADILNAQANFMEQLNKAGDTGFLVAHPKKGSACKRNNLFLRWMVRQDDVDPGCWKNISAAHLIIPLDTHMYRIGTMLGFTTRKQANMKTAMEITRGFQNILPEDPVKYDFCLTRFGIRREMGHDVLKKYFD